MNETMRYKGYDMTARVGVWEIATKSGRSRFRASLVTAFSLIDKIYREERTLRMLRWLEARRKEVQA